MTNRFEKYFEYYWWNDKNYALVSEQDKEVFRELPPSIQGAIYREFLFKDFLEAFNVHFSFEKPPSF